MAASMDKEGGGRDQAVTRKPIFSRIRARVRDKSKWPRRWWWPLESTQTEDDSDWQDLHDEASKTIRRVMLTIVGYSFFCILTLGTPDKLLVENNNKIKLPFANIEIDFGNFLIVGPIVLIGLLIYMHIFIVYWRGIPPGQVARPLPFIFNMPGRFARLLSGFLFYWLAPLVLLIFVRKAGVLTGLPLLVLMTALVTTALVWLEIRYRPADHRGGVRDALLWIVLIGLLAVSVKFLWVRSVEHGPILIAFASDVAEPIVAAIWSDDSEAETQVASVTVVDENSQPDSSGTSGSGQASTKPAKTEPKSANVKPVVTKSKLTKKDQGGEHTTQVPQIVQRGAQSQQVSNFLSRRLNLANADLRKADLMSWNLVGADLSGADLSGLRLNGSPESSKRVWNANLSDANLSKSSLSYVEFTGANLTRASFLNAKLDIVGFVRADLRGVDFSEARWSFVEIDGADIRGVKGLNCERLKTLVRWESAYRDPELACGEPIPSQHEKSMNSIRNIRP